ncbi:5-oxoprolinase [Histoplasma capsulatum H143]|uniref:5-oxoprolinase n=1 Tax=Ajellomyces capsulatus (strain H143) TaxID=544712 RepID=C6H7R5_AJECH|nr:5-oxoprolinase [Histoplasma capsulatum H143]
MDAPVQRRGIRISIDRGGTFTDCVGNPGSGKLENDIVIKLLSEDPNNYSDAPLVGISRLLSKLEGRKIPRGARLATNALLERKGGRMALLVTKGFKDCLKIGNQSRPKIFDLAIRKPYVLYEKSYRGAVKILLQTLYDEGFRSIDVCLMHGYTFPDHETLIGRLARQTGFNHISLSHELFPMVKLVPRATSACADAYLTPAIRKYIPGFQAGFEGRLGASSLKEEHGSKRTRCEFMQSDGDLVDIDNSGLRAILSGPAGGVVGNGLTSYVPLTDIPVIGFDMGLPALMLAGSRLFYRNVLFVVGPESAGAQPGPGCYHWQLLVAHEVAMAENLGIKQISVHRYSSVLPAYEMALEDVVDESQALESKVWFKNGGIITNLKPKMVTLKEAARGRLHDQGFNDESIVFEEYLNMRYRGTESSLMIINPKSQITAELPENGGNWGFGKALSDRDIIVDDVRVRAISKSFQLEEAQPQNVGDEKKFCVSQVYFEGGRRRTPVYKIEDLNVNNRIHGRNGPDHLDAVINIGASQFLDTKVSLDTVDPVMLSIFGHRCMTIAEQMGRALQKTSVSTNVKERFHYSCALFDSDGGLVANALHLQVHLGSMSTCAVENMGWKTQAGTPGFHAPSFKKVIPRSCTRCLANNINDLKAQIAANHKGINHISVLIKEYGEDTVQFYMNNIQDNAELSVRRLLKSVSKKNRRADLVAVDYTDDGSLVRLKISIDAEKGEAIFDFEGTSSEVYGRFQFPS